MSVPGRRGSDQSAFEAAAGCERLHAAAIAYPLSYPEVSTVILSCKSVEQVEANLGGESPATLPAAMLERIAQVQRSLGVYPAGRAARLWRRLKSRILRA